MMGSGVSMGFFTFSQKTFERHHGSRAYMDEARREVPVWRIEHTYLVGSLPISMESLYLCLPDQSDAFFGFVHTPTLSVSRSNGSSQSVIRQTGYQSIRLGKIPVFGRKCPCEAFWRLWLW